MILQNLIILIYSFALILIFLYALAQLNLLFNYLSSKNKKDNSPKFNLNNPDEIPYVTIQLPVYNELYVMERLLHNIAKIDYPKDKLEIQVLDDSTDESFENTKKHIAQL
ncbi:MAG: glycosyl transferase family 2, partial [Bacteroidetes bacterium]|nr:glycosyl transferase family 2 [Bacteroidota bacterium]